MDGRDIGSKVLPDAELKIYLTASVEERAMRRYREYIEKGMDCDLEELRREVEARDKNDMTRAESPLVKVADEILLDTSDLTYEEAQGQFASMKILDGMYSTMKLEDIPLAANGWSVYCRYTNRVGSTDTARATITVTAKQ